MLREALVVRVVGVFLRVLGAVVENDFGQFGGGGSAINRPPKAVADEPRQIAYVVDMGMGQHHRLHARRIERQRLPILQSQRLEALKQPAIDEHAGLLGCEQILRAGDGFRRAVEGELGHERVFVRRSGAGRSAFTVSSSAPAGNAERLELAGCGCRRPRWGGRIGHPHFVLGAWIPMGIYDREYYRDEPRRSSGVGEWSAVTTLIVLNVAVFIADQFSPALFRDRDGTIVERWLDAHMALRADLFTHPWQAWQLITSGFAHMPGSIMHILGNMFVLWVFGRDVEGVYGRAMFYRVYFTALIFSGLGWVLFQQVFSPGVPASAIGASGAVMGIAMVYIFHFPHRMFLLFFAIPVPAWVLGILYVLLDLGGATGSFSLTKEHVANTAHLAALSTALFSIELVGRCSLSCRVVGFRDRPGDPNTAFTAAIPRPMPKTTANCKSGSTRFSPRSAAREKPASPPPNAARSKKPADGTGARGRWAGARGERRGARACYAGRGYR